jgi:hypothetical protein
MVEANFHLRLLPTSILDIYRVFQVLLLFAESRANGYTLVPHITQAKLTPDFQILGHLWSGNVMVAADIHLTLLPKSILGI